MKKFLIVMLILGFMFFFACRDNIEIVNNSNPKPINFLQKASLKKHKKIKIKLDSLTAQPYTSMGIYEDTVINKDYLHFFNSNNYQIYFYDLDNFELAFKIQLEKEGENGVGKNVRGYQIANLDSIYVHNYPYELSLINQLAKKKAVVRLVPSSKIDTLLFYPNPEINSYSPLVFKNQELIINGYVGGEFEGENLYNRPFIIFYNFNTQQLRYGTGYTTPYQIGNWGGGFLRQVTSCYNPDKDLIVYNLPIEHYLYASKDGKKLEKYYAGSKYFDEILSLNKSKDSYQTMDKDEIYAVYAERPSYSLIIYDKYRKVYYRFAELPIDKFDKNQHPKKTIKEVSIIILDENFNYLGETMMPQGIYHFKSFFITKDGLGFLKPSSDEDNAVFDIFKIVQKNEK